MKPRAITEMSINLHEWCCWRKRSYGCFKQDVVDASHQCTCFHFKCERARTWLMSHLTRKSPSTVRGADLHRIHRNEIFLWHKAIPSRAYIFMSGNFKLVRHTTQVTNESEQILPHHAEERCKMLNDNKTSNESRKSIFLFLLFPVDVRKHFCCLV